MDHVSLRLYLEGNNRGAAAEREREGDSTTLTEDVLTYPFDDRYPKSLITARSSSEVIELEIKSDDWIGSGEEIMDAFHDVELDHTQSDMQQQQPKATKKEQEVQKQHFHWWGHAQRWTTLALLSSWTAGLLATV